MAPKAKVTGLWANKERAGLGTGWGARGLPRSRDVPALRPRATIWPDFDPPHGRLPAREPKTSFQACTGLWLWMPAELVTRLPRPAPAAEPMSLGGPCLPTRLHCQDITPSCANCRFTAATGWQASPSNPDEKQAPLRLPAASYLSQEHRPGTRLAGGPASSCPPCVGESLGLYLIQNVLANVGLQPLGGLTGRGHQSERLLAGPVYIPKS